MHGQGSLCLPGSFAPAQVSRAFRGGWWETSARWCAYRSVRWATDGRTARCVALSLGSVSVTTRPGRTRLPLQQRAEQACRRPTVATRLDEAIEDVTRLIDGTPERAPLALEGDEALVQVPSVAQPALSTREPARVD